MKKTAKKSRSKKLQKQKKLLAQCINPQAAGIDVGAHELVVSVDEICDDQPVRTFETFTEDILTMRDWLVECDVTTVAMESTGNYWITAFQILEAAGIEVCLVNACHVKGVPGRPKTDVYDAQWLRRLHRAGLLNKSFRPDDEVVTMRYLARHRETLVNHCSDVLRRLQKVLTEMNVKLHHVFSDIDGVSSWRIIEAILEGQRDPSVLWKLRDPRCKATEETFTKAINGDWRPEYLFVLTQCFEEYQAIKARMTKCDEQIAQACEKIASVIEPTEVMPTPAKKNQHRRKKNTPNFDVFEEGYRLLGVDISDVGGFAGGTIVSLISEMGNRDQILSAFKGADAFSNWLSICPDNRKTGGKVFRTKTRPSANRVAQAFRLAAFSLDNANCELGRFCRRMKARLGKAEGITATAHKLARIFYGMIKSGKPYDENEAFKKSPQQKKRRLQNLKKNARELGYELVPAKPKKEYILA